MDYLNSDCENSYCSIKCQELDNHLEECSCSIFRKIETYLDTEDFHRHIQKMSIEFEDILMFTELFFRVYKQIDSLKNVNSITIGNSTQYFNWNKFEFTEIPLELSRTLPEFPLELFTYMTDYDSITEVERIEFDSKLNIDLPDDEFFYDTIFEVDIMQLVNGVVDVVCKNIEFPENSDSYMNINSQKTNQTEQFSSTNVNPATSEESNVELHPKKIERNELLNSLILVSEYSEHMSNISFNGSSESIQKLIEQLEKKSKYGRQLKRKSSFIICNKEDKERVQGMKLIFRMAKCEKICKDYNFESKPLDQQFGFWVIRLKNLLDDDEIKPLIGSYNWNDVVKAFFFVR